MGCRIAPRSPIFLPSVPPSRTVYRKAAGNPPGDKSPLAYLCFTTVGAARTPSGVQGSARCTLFAASDSAPWRGAAAPTCGLNPFLASHILCFVGSGFLDTNLYIRCRHRTIYAIMLTHTSTLRCVPAVQMSGSLRRVYRRRISRLWAGADARYQGACHGKPRLRSVFARATRAWKASFAAYIVGVRT